MNVLLAASANGKIVISVASTRPSLVRTTAAQAVERQAAHQRLADADGFADLNVALGYDARIRGADERVLELLVRGFYG